MASKQDNTKLFKVTNLLKDSITNNIYSINKNIIKIELYYKLIDEYLKDSFVYLKKFSKEINNSFDKIKNQTHIKNSVFLDVLTALENFNYNNIKIIQLSKQLEELNKIIYERSKKVYEIRINPPKINEHSNITININNISQNSYHEINDEENKTQSIMKQSHLYPEKSYKIKTFVKEREQSREKFLDSISILIKRILLQCNYIIENELKEEKYSNIEDNYKNFNYPIIEEP